MERTPNDILAHNLHADNRPELTQSARAGVAQKHSLTLKYLKAPNMDIKCFKGTLMLRVLYFAATLDERRSNAVRHIPIGWGDERGVTRH